MCARPRQAHGKHRTFAGLARHCHIAAHHPRQLAGDGEAEPGATEALRRREVGLGKLLEEFACCSGVMPMPVSATASSTKSRPSCSPFSPQLDLTFLCELAGIAEKVEQDLPQAHRVHGQCAEFSCASTVEAVLVLLGKLAGGTDHLFDQLCKLHHLRIKFELPASIFDRSST